MDHDPVTTLVVIFAGVPHFVTPRRPRLTTMAGFGSLMVAHHKGVWSLGLLLVIGSAATLIASLVVLPTLVHLPGEPLRFPAERQGIRGGWPGWRARGGQSWHPERSQAR